MARVVPKQSHMKFGDIVTWRDADYADGRYMVIGPREGYEEEDMQVICLTPPSKSEWLPGEDAAVTTKEMALTQ